MQTGDAYAELEGSITPLYNISLKNAFTEIWKEYYWGNVSIINSKTAQKLKLESAVERYQDGSQLLTSTMQLNMAEKSIYIYYPMAANIGNIGFAVFPWGWLLRQAKYV